MTKLRNPIMLALDVDTDDQASKILDQVGSQVGALKIGPRLNLKYGASIIEKAQKYAPVFVDNKYFDITSTVLAAAQTSFDAGASFVTVHSLNGAETLYQLAELERKLNQIRPFRILAVTILTSWSPESFADNFKTQSIGQHVLSLAQLVQKSGLSGLVCSGHELPLIQDMNLFKVIPGIRLESDLHGKVKKNTQDQKRVMTPKQAVQAGASAVVIGRSILSASEPRKVLQGILEGLSS